MNATEFFRAVTKTLTLSVIPMKTHPILSTTFAFIQKMRMAMDTLELDEEDVHNEHPLHVVTLLMNDKVKRRKLLEFELEAVSPTYIYDSTRRDMILKTIDESTMSRSHYPAIQPFCTSAIPPLAPQAYGSQSNLSPAPYALLQHHFALGPESSLSSSISSTYAS